MLDESAVEDDANNFRESDRLRLCLLLSFTIFSILSSSVLDIMT